MRGKALTCLGCLLLVLGLLSCPAGAVPARPENNCVVDQAGVLESDTVRYMVEKNQTLNQETGATIAVACVDFLDGKNIADYALELFNDWQLGDAQRGNGLLLLLAIGEDNYYVLQGVGLQSALSDSTLKSYTNDYLETDFAAQRYDAGVRKIFDAFYQWFEDYYAGTAAQPAAPAHSGQDVYNMGSMVAFTILVFVAVVVLISLANRRRGYYGYYSSYRPYTHRVWPLFLSRRHRHYGPPRPPGSFELPNYRPHTGSSSNAFHSGGSSRGGGAGRQSGGSSIFRSSSTRSSLGSGGSRSSFRSGGGSFRSGGMSRGGGAGRR